MKNELVESLRPQTGDKIFVDATLGSGGHSELLLQKLSGRGHLFSFDVDIDAIKYATDRLKVYKNVTIINDSYVNIKKNLQDLGIEEITGGVMFDFGASFHQLTSDSRGFSFQKNSNLDMRFNQSQEKTAYDIVNIYSEEKLSEIFSNYGEEHYSKRIAKHIVEKRKQKKIATTFDLVNLIEEAIPSRSAKIKSFSRIFQAIRIETNSELKNINEVFLNIVPFLSQGAIISAISFHSLEDRIIKNAFKLMSISEKQHNKYAKFSSNKVSEEKGMLKILTKKPVLPTLEEIKSNLPSRSAKMRSAMKV